MNTIEEEQAMANYLELTLEEVRQKYSILGESIYQGLMTYIVDYLLEKTSREDFSKWRIHKDEEAIKRVESLIEKTEIWKNREDDISPNSGNMRSYATKKEMYERINNPSLNDTVKRNENVFFPDIATMTPILKIDNVLEQVYDIKTIITKIDLEEQNEIFNQLGYESYAFINQASDIKTKEELAQMVSDVRVSSINDVTNETRAGIQSLKDKEIEQEGVTNDR